MFLKLLFLSIALGLIAMFGMLVRIIFLKDGRFPVISIGKNKEMRKCGILCVKTEEKIIHGNLKLKKKKPACNDCL